MISNNILITFAVALCFIQYSEAITCYKCQSFNKGCGDKDFDASLVQSVDCSTTRSPNDNFSLKPTKCIKTITSDNAGSIVVRDCQWLPNNALPNSSNQCYVNNRLVPCGAVCDSNLCNSANAKQIATFGFLAVVVGILTKLIN